MAEKQAEKVMEFRKLTKEEVASRRKRNIAIAVSLFVVSMLFMVTTMFRVAANMGNS